MGRRVSEVDRIVQQLDAEIAELQRAKDRILAARSAPRERSKKKGKTEKAAAAPEPDPQEDYRPATPFAGRRG